MILLKEACDGIETCIAINEKTMRVCGFEYKGGIRITQINGQGLPFLTGMLCGQPSVLDALEKLVAIGKEFGKIMHANRSYTQEMAQLGFPLLWSAVTYCAYDMVSDYLRGMKGSMLDMYRAPDKLLKAVETIIPLTDAVLEYGTY